MGGICDIAVANSYYVGLMRSGAGGPDQQKWGAAIKVILPTFAGGGTHVNVSGASIAKHSPNRAAAVRFLEYLVSDEAQKIYAEANYEYPVKAGRGCSSPHRGARHAEGRPDSAWPTSRGIARRRASSSTRSASTAESRQPSARGPAGRAPGSWLAASGLLCLLVLAPVAALAVAARAGSADLWRHLIAYVLPAAVRDTLVLLAGVGLLAGDDRHRRGVAGHGLRLPGPRVSSTGRCCCRSPVPTYIVAYAYLDILHPVGPVQTALRALLGIDSPRDFRLPDIRSMTGCIALLGFVLYPYVYLTTRAMFLMQTANLIDVSRTLGTTQARRVLSRRAAAGHGPPSSSVSRLALLEALNDIGASEFLGVRTLTVSIYSTWVTRSDLPGRGADRARHAGDGPRCSWCWSGAHASSDGTPTTPSTRVRSNLTACQGGRRRGARRRAWSRLSIGFVIPAAYLVRRVASASAVRGLSPASCFETINTIAISLLATVLTRRRWRRGGVRDAHRRTARCRPRSRASRHSATPCQARCWRSGCCRS